MHIIFGDSVDHLRDKFTVLELDTIEQQGQVTTAWCVVENIPLADFALLDSYQKVHNDLMQAYRAQNWEYCVNAIHGLRGKWNGELDSFYDSLLDRVTHYKTELPASDWTGHLIRP